MSKCDYMMDMMKKGKKKLAKHEKKEMAMGGKEMKMMKAMSKKIDGALKKK